MQVKRYGLRGSCESRARWGPLCGAHWEARGGAGGDLLRLTLSRPLWLRTAMGGGAAVAIGGGLGAGSCALGVLGGVGPSAPAPRRHQSFPLLSL